jgi:hypothetical protein
MGPLTLPLSQLGRGRRGGVILVGIKIFNAFVLLWKEKS